MIKLVIYSILLGLVTISTHACSFGSSVGGFNPGYYSPWGSWGSPWGYGYYYYPLTYYRLFSSQDNTHAINDDELFGDYDSNIMDAEYTMNGVNQNQLDCSH